MPLEAGIEAHNAFEVEGRLLTDVAGTLGYSVLSTPGMIAMMERTAAMLVHPLLPEGRATVGFEVCIKHVAGAPAGAHCTAHAQLVEIVDGRKLRFDVEVTDADGRTIGVGRHERRVVGGA
jgi:fluoroacetyl-CoA thioesterase